MDKIESRSHVVQKEREREREIGAQHPQTEYPGPIRRLFFRASRAPRDDEERGEANTRECRRGARGLEEGGGRKGGYRKPLTPPRPMPWRLYRFTTERRTSVNRYLLTLDFPWPPPTRPPSSLEAATPLHTV